MSSCGCAKPKLAKVGETDSKTLKVYAKLIRLAATHDANARGKTEVLRCEFWKED